MTKIDELYTENDYISTPFQDEPPEYDVWNVINGIETLLKNDYYANHSVMTEQLIKLKMNLKQSLEKL